LAAERDNVGGGLQVAIAAVALVFVVYFAFLVVGIFFKLLFLAAAAALGVVIWRAWGSGS
jgi:hypothetical protein